MRGYTLKEVEKKLKQCGYEKSRQRGSHIMWKKDGRVIAVPSKIKRVIALKIINELDKETI